jgi:type IV secretory pathway VirB10-like protein
MRSAKIVFVATMTIPLAGCVLSGKPKSVAAVPTTPPTAAPAPPPEPLSIPQTHVDLPAPQPVDPQALVTAPPVEPAPPPAQKPVTPPPQRTAVRPANLPKAPEPAAEPEQQPARAPIQEILSPDQQKDYKERAHKYQADARSVLASPRPRTSANQRRQEQEINNFLKQSEQAENTGDLRLALQLAERAYTLAKELQSGK